MKKKYKNEWTVVLNLVTYSATRKIYENTVVELEFHEKLCSKFLGQLEITPIVSPSEIREI